MAAPGYVRATEYFMRLQKEKYGYIEEGNVVQAKWDMRVVMEHIDDNQMLKKLFQYFLFLSDDKSLKKFFYVYDEYYQKMLLDIKDRAHRKAVREATIKGRID